MSAHTFGLCGCGEPAVVKLNGVACCQVCYEASLAAMRKNLARIWSLLR